jgi:hypothetical protein
MPDPIKSSVNGIQRAMAPMAGNWQQQYALKKLQGPEKRNVQRLIYEKPN